MGMKLLFLIKLPFQSHRSACFLFRVFAPTISSFWKSLWIITLISCLQEKYKSKPGAVSLFFVLILWRVLCVCVPPSHCESEWLSHVWLFVTPMNCSPLGSSVHGILQARILRVGCQFLLQGTFPAQGLNLDLPQCRQILYHLSH